MTPSLTPVQQAIRDAFHAAVPDDFTAATWADARRIVSNGPETGEKWQTDRVPGLREVLEAGSHPRVKEIVTGGAAQWGKTEGFSLNYIGYYIDIHRVPVLVAFPKKEAGEEFSTGRFDRMVQWTPALRNLFEDPRTRDSGNTRMHKIFPGGEIFIVSANVVNDVSSKTICLAVIEELDRMPKTVGTPENPQGDPIAMIDKRTTHYKRTGEALMLKSSSPTVDGQSRIQQAYKASDQCEFWCRCPGCDAWQEPHEELCRDPLWQNVMWSKIGLPAAEAKYVCPHCGVYLDDDERKEMLRDYRWVSRAAVAAGVGHLSLMEWYSHPAFNGVAGFWFPGTASVWVTMAQMAEEVTHASRENNLEAKQTFVNLTLGELWKPWEQIDKDDLTYRVETYLAEVPARVVLLTFAVDVQLDRIEVEVAGWSVDEERWSIDYRVFRGDPSRVEVEGEVTVWDELWDYLEYEWQHELGPKLKVKCGCIDSGFSCGEAVYEFCKKAISRRWKWREGRERRHMYWAIKGGNVHGQPIAPKKPSRVGSWNVQLRTIGTYAAKDKVFAALKLGWDKQNEWVGGPGSYHFPSNSYRVKYKGGTPSSYDKNYFDQVASEHRKPGFDRWGHAVYTWQLIQEGRPNEGWDNLIYNLGALRCLKSNLKIYEKVLLEAVEGLRVQGPGAGSREPDDHNGNGDRGGSPEGGSSPTPASRPSTPGSFRNPRRSGGGYNPRSW
jgi:phage terminase large subunit GpA-like protein